MAKDKQRRWRSDRHKHKSKITNKVDFSKLKNKIIFTKEEKLLEDTDLDKTIIYKMKETKQAEKAEPKVVSEDVAVITEMNLAEAEAISQRAQGKAEEMDKPKKKWQFWRRKTDKTDKKPFKLTWKHGALAVGATIVLALIAYTTLIYGGKIFVDEDKLIISPPTTVETKDGEILWYLYDQYRIPVGIEDIPDHVKDAFISVEDKRFYDHSGVDFRSITRAIFRDIVARSKVEGGSTLTQQLSKNLFLTNDKSWYRKIKEMMISLYLEREFSKDEILEMYLNVIYFGEGQYGVEAASNKFFNKRIEDITLEEAALLAAIVKAPNGYSPIAHPEKAKDRRNIVLQTMVQNNFITEAEAKEAQAKEITLDITKRTFNPAYHAFVDVAIKEAEEKYDISIEELQKNRYRIITSLDETTQKIAYEQFSRGEKFPGKNIDTVEGAFVMMDEETGELVSILGGRKYKTGDFNRANQPLGQPGSTLKPLAVYAPALETEQFHPYAVLPDVEQVWNDKPVRNVDFQYTGQLSLYQALVQSKNTSAVWLLDEIGIDKGKSYLEKMGIAIPDNDVRIALGDLEYGLSPIQLAQAYRTFARNGEMIEAHTITEIFNKQGQKVAESKAETTKVFSEQVAWTMTEMLKSVVTEGTGRAGYYPHELAGKTGTTEHPKVEGGIKDAWFVGYTPEYVTAMWMGYDNNAKEGHYLTGGSAYPTELTKMILTQVDQQKHLKETFTKPENVQALEDPVSLPFITDLKSSFTFGGFKVVKGKLQWTPAEDSRIVYRIYMYDGAEHTLLDEVTGEGEYIIDKFSLFDTDAYYVVPYNPQTEQEGDKSNSVQMPF